MIAECVCEGEEAGVWWSFGNVGCGCDDIAGGEFVVGVAGRAVACLVMKVASGRLFHRSYRSS